MYKKHKKFTAVILSVVMLLSTAIPAFAFDNNQTINNIPIPDITEQTQTSPAQAKYFELLEGNYLASELKSKFAELFGEYSREEILNNYSEIFDMPADQVDQGIINILTILPSQPSRADLVRFDVPEIIPPIENMEAPSIPSISDEEIPVFTEFTTLPALIPQLPEKPLNTRTTNPNEFQITKTGEYPPDKTRANESDVNVTLVSTTNNSVTLDLFYNTKHYETNNILLVWDTTNATTTPLFGSYAYGKPVGKTGRYTINNLKAGATYIFYAKVYDAQKALWLQKDLKIRTTGAKSPSMSITGTTSSSFTVNASFPVETSWGNRIDYWNGSAWVDLTKKGVYSASGSYTITGLDFIKEYTILFQHYDHWTDKWMPEIRLVAKLPKPPEVLVRSETSNLIFNFEQVDINRFAGSNYTTWKNRMDAVYSNLYDLTGAKQHSGSKIEIQSTRDKIPNYWGLSGNPILVNQKYVPDMIDKVNTQGDWVFGVMHELGHDFDSYRWNFDSEFFANFKMAYSVDRNNAKVYVGYTNYYTGLSALRQYYKSYSNPNGGGISYDQSVARGSYHHDGLTYSMLNIQQNIGWEPFRQTFRYFNNLQSNEIPATNIGKFNLFLMKLADYSGRDVFAMLTANDKSVYGRQFGGNVEKPDADFINGEIVEYGYGELEFVITPFTNSVQKNINKSSEQSFEHLNYINFDDIFTGMSEEDVVIYKDYLLYYSPTIGEEYKNYLNEKGELLRSVGSKSLIDSKSVAVLTQLEQNLLAIGLSRGIVSAFMAMGTSFVSALAEGPLPVAKIILIVSTLILTYEIIDNWDTVKANWSSIVNAFSNAFTGYISAVDLTSAFSPYSGKTKTDLLAQDTKNILDNITKISFDQSRSAAHVSQSTTQTIINDMSNKRNRFEMYCSTVGMRTDTYLLVINVDTSTTGDLNKYLSRNGSVSGYDTKNYQMMGGQLYILISAKTKKIFHVHYSRSANETNTFRKYNSLNWQLYPIIQYNSVFDPIWGGGKKFNNKQI
jgi:hypothetical protein